MTDDMALTEEEAGLFDALCEGKGPFALARTLFDGEKTTVIVVVQVPENDDDDDASWHITPVYVQVTEKMFDRLTDPLDVA